LSSQPPFGYGARVKKAPPSKGLSTPEAELWQAWQRATDAVMARVERDIAEATGLSGADYGVLSQLALLGRGTLRQQDLANSMAWHKSRLSHHLSRMEQRALVERRQAKINSVLVVITPLGKRALRAALPVHARSVRSRLLGKVPRAERKQVLLLLARLASE
jgi:DNA-binding MarR family transcriptional regulator